MKVYHATTQKNLASIQEHGLLVACADSSAKIKACWVATASNRAWGVLHTIRKHHAQLDEVVVIEIDVPRSWLARFRTGLWYCAQDIPATRIGEVTEGTMFSLSASE